MTMDEETTARLDAMFEDARAFCLARHNYTPEAYISPEARERHIDNDASATLAETRFAMPWDAGYARGLTAGRGVASGITDPITVERGNLQELFDIIVSSMDYGSGFLDEEQIGILRRTAEQIGIDPMQGTPSDDRHKYPHRYVEHEGQPWMGCRVCRKARDRGRHEEMQQS